MKRVAQGSPTQHLTKSPEADLFRTTIFVILNLQTIHDRSQISKRRIQFIFNELASGTNYNPICRYLQEFGALLFSLARHKKGYAVNNAKAAYRSSSLLDEVDEEIRSIPPADGPLLLQPLQQQAGAAALTYSLLREVHHVNKVITAMDF